MATDLNIRIASAADLESLVRLAGAFRDQLRQLSPSNAEFWDAIARLLQDPDTEFFLAQDAQGNALGYIQCRYRYSAWVVGYQAELEDVFVLPEVRRQGAGRQLVQFAIDRAIEKGCRSIGLNTNERNIGAIALYQQLGLRAERSLWHGGRQLWLEKAL
ncbi:GNAT family N-acetyltransferase [Trichocoleus sp. FACHB-591]|uniref:GNAT family N-acetyltransferase n=1 Tax=Trichocoleus sp. FACHB-591 TaxID=2692872 RepID=UPI0016838A3A|nr:GNAT family N-acetyltransferase [Trichocoleus sp. FACHB-591]MBD2095516.1 GNAT family N-acetyltransferase [Trichocoleus sp. FACHB-591]